MYFMKEKKKSDRDVRFVDGLPTITVSSWGIRDCNIPCVLRELIIIIISDTDVPYLHRETAIFETLRRMNEVGPFKFVFFAADSE